MRRSWGAIYHLKINSTRLTEGGACTKSSGPRGPTRALCVFNFKNATWELDISLLASTRSARVGLKVIITAPREMSNTGFAASRSSNKRPSDVIDWRFSYKQIQSVSNSVASRERESRSISAQQEEGLTCSGTQDRALRRLPLSSGVLSWCVTASPRKANLANLGATLSARRLPPTTTPQTWRAEVTQAAFGPNIAFAPSASTQHTT